MLKYSIIVWNYLFWPKNKTPFYKFDSDPVSDSDLDPDSNPDSNPDPKWLFRIRLGSGSGQKFRILTDPVPVPDPDPQHWQRECAMYSHHGGIRRTTHNRLCVNCSGPGYWGGGGAQQPGKAVVLGRLSLCLCMRVSDKGQAHNYNKYSKVVK